MANPILQMVHGTGQQGQQMNLLSLLKYRNNPGAIFNDMINKNQQFRQFVEANKGKSAEQIARENNIDVNLLRQFM